MEKNETLFMVSGILCNTEEDTYNDGCIPNTYNEWDENYTFTGNSVKEVINKVLTHYSMDTSNAVVYDDEIISSSIVDKNLCPLTKEEFKDWKNGTFKAYAFDIRFKVFAQIKHNTLMKKTGIESYD